ncbi:MAG TPA: EAL domain-containing protein, partial [Pseudoxanthomonas sp.]|nr:EAL domain-containing protein [Pseudoxanthomonas sp.]
MLNREQLFDAIDRLASPRTQEGALLVVRMQNLREYEAIFGYDAGDFLVQAFEARLQECLRSADVIVRIGECDFAVMLPGLGDRNHVVLAAAKVARTFQEPLPVCGKPAWVNVAVGACAVADAGTPATLCRQADAACKRAWNLRERHVLHQGASLPTVGYDDLHQAIAGNQLQVFLQPIFSLQGGALKSFESLSRWTHPLHGPIGPAVFVPMAEQAGLIHELTRWNLNATFRHCSPWLETRPGLKCAVNVSPIALVADGFVEQVIAAIRIWRLRPSSVVVEVTETAFVDNHEQLAHALTELHELGVGISIDDFGTGY